ncbi:MAG: UDP-N-acetylglucosamine--N-acetylmuramyl-(pentapeptide) pyrophosphoryl-undecaprenol N-acetylglucosamine transferase, partial [Thermomicrobiales bacterium]|nr:UDP-N-acetylglucosamine--N-acetylmuramyl-(pentapeptide) pyrophosphoryl-undecaprenol N-acetylglucosamine transferase [Thermomicrobiales bacterium]
EGNEAKARGIPFRSVSTGKFRRYLDLRTVADAVRVPIGVPQAWWILRDFKPDVIFSTGGYVSTPSVIGGTRMAPVLSHEQTAVLGLATRLNARFVDVQALTFESSLAYTKDRSKTVITGNPVRGSLKEGNRDNGLERFGFRSDLPVLFVTGGARGSSPLNERIEAILDHLIERAHVLHQIGARSDNPDFERLSRRREALAAEARNRYVVVERLRSEMADVLAMADVMLARAGAGTVAEIAYLGKTAVLIPLPGAGGNEQHRNAEALSSIDGAIVVDQTEATPERLRSIILELFENPERRIEIGRNATKAGRPDAAARLADQLLALAEQRRRG